MLAQRLPYNCLSPKRMHQVRMEMLPFECYIHANAIMWRVVYRELRALTNDASMNLNPMEINDVYEEVEFDLESVPQNSWKIF